MTHAPGADLEALAALAAAPAAALRSPVAPDLTDLGVRGVARLVRSGQVSAEEAVHAYLHRIGEVDAEVHALVRVDAERAVEDAREIDRARLLGSALGPLAGVPFVVKDNIDVQRQATTAGSRAATDVVALHDAPIVARLRAAGAILLGRANMDELAMGASTRTSAFGPTSNPWDLRRSPGGSSGGCAAAVAAGLAAFAIGTDTGGSVREPAAQCGVLGLAPTPGRLPMDGVLPFSPDLDRVGPITWTAGDAAAVLAATAGCSAPSGRMLRVGVVGELNGPVNRPGVRDRVTAVLEALGARGHALVPVSIPDAHRALGAYMAVSSAACIPHIEPFVRTGRTGPEATRRVELGRALLGSARLAAAVEVHQRLRRQAATALRACDVLISPTMPTTAPLLADVVRSSDLTDPMTAPYTDCWTVLANLAGLPSVSVPAGCSTEDGMPVGVMLSGRPGADADLLELARVVELATL